ncbi:MAG: phosphatidylserine decarboxylase [Syntrophales bacterium]|jgi:phosphatidylserine decarboxylase|nr:phosphatidylserine decarboxylase [Syntrophales bacterium]
MKHQYIERESRNIHTEQLFGDTAVRFLYSRIREHAPLVFRAMTGARVTKWLGMLNYDDFLSQNIRGRLGLFTSEGIDLRECLDPPTKLDTLKKVFERKIRYWVCRPMPNDPATVVSPCDAKMLFGSFCEMSGLFLKGKFFTFDELIGINKKRWQAALQDGAFAVFRLTPEKYHYNHTPVAGKIVDFYHISGRYHACNPNAVVSVLTPYSKNKRVVTVIDTDVPGGTGAGLVAMIEVAALMIGDIHQCYSEARYDHPVPIGAGMFVKQGFPKSLFRPGGSSVVLIFQKDRVRFADDIVANMARPGVESIFSRGFGQPLVETDVKVRSFIASAFAKSAGSP